MCVCLFLCLAGYQQRALDQREGAAASGYHEKKVVVWTGAENKSKDIAFSQDLKEGRKSFHSSRDIKTSFEKLKLCDSLTLGHAERA